MDHHGRRNRRGRERRVRQAIPSQAFLVRNSQKGWSLMDGFASIFIMTSLLAIIYLMLDYHCTACNSKCDLSNITRSINDVSNNISIMKESYNDLETKVMKFSHELPKIEGQIEILEAFANTIGGGDYKDTNANKHKATARKCPHGRNLQNATEYLPKKSKKVGQD